MKNDRISNTQGNGDPNCKICSGRGHVSSESLNLIGMPKVKICKCVRIKERKANVEKIWPGLFEYPNTGPSPLREQVNADTFITAREGIFFTHLKHVAIRESSKWFCRLEADQDLARAWLANIELEGGTILDPELATSTLKYVVLDDLAKPPDLLIVKLGVKRAANKRMPEVLMEVLQMRAHLDKPTWLWDQPNNRFDANHLCFSTHLQDYVRNWDHIRLSGASGGADASTSSSGSTVPATPSASNIPKTKYQ